MSKFSLKDILAETLKRTDLSKDERDDLIRAQEKLQNMKINILVTGATGCGKSSTINALFNGDIAKVGQGVDPETMDIQKYDWENLVIWDSPGLGDGKEADERHSRNIINKLLEKDKDGNALIDVVLVILDGGSRDLGTSYELITEVIIQTLQKSGERGTDRLLVAINQCDMAMKGRYWNHETNRPEPTLENFLEEKVASTRNRIRESTGVTVNPIYYSAGFKDGNADQRPYNISRLLRHIIENTPSKKRAIYAENINADKIRIDTHIRRREEQKKIEDNIFNSLSELVGSAKKVVDAVVDTIGSVVSSAASAVASVGRSIVSTVSSWFGW